jgi:hypothetical protein
MNAQAVNTREITPRSPGPAHAKAICHRGAPSTNRLSPLRRYHQNIAPQIAQRNAVATGTNTSPTEAVSEW